VVILIALQSIVISQNVDENVETLSIIYWTVS